MYPSGIYGVNIITKGVLIDVKISIIYKSIDDRNSLRFCNLGYLNYHLGCVNGTLNLPFKNIQL